MSTKSTSVLPLLSSQTVIQNAHRMLWRKYRGQPLWTMVSDLTGYGSATSGEICDELGFDPHQPCKKRLELKQATASPAPPETKE